MENFWKGISKLAKGKLKYSKPITTIKIEIIFIAVSPSKYMCIYVYMCVYVCLT